MARTFRRLARFLVQEGDNLDMVLGEKGREILAAGVFFEGKKPTKKCIVENS